MINIRDPRMNDLYDSNHSLYENVYSTEFNYYSDAGVYNEYDKPHKVITLVKSGVTSTTKYTYDLNGNVKTITDADNGVVTYTYQDGTNILTDPSDFVGLIEKVEDRYGNETEYNYNAHGWLTSTDLPLSVSTSISEYDDMGNPLKVVDAESNVIKYDYDILGRRVKVYIPDNTPTVWTDNDTVSTTYYLNHNVDVITDARNNTTEYTYDKMGRVKSVEKNDNNPTTDDIWYTDYSYDNVTNNPVVTSTDPEGIVSVQYFDAIGRLEKSDSGGTVVNYDYDKIGNMTKIVDAEGRESIVKYDKLNRKKEVVIDPNRPEDNYTGEDMSTSYTYDYVGNGLTVKDGEDYETIYTYDELGRLDKVFQDVTMDVSGTPTVVTTTTDYDYDGVETIGSIDYIVNKITDAEGGVKKTYLDPLGRIYKETDEGTNTTDSERMTTTHEYYDNGNVLKTTYSDGSDVEYTYYESGEVKRIEYDDTSGEEDYTDFEYDENRNLESATGKREGEDISATFSYNVHNRVTSRVENGNTIQYQYYDNGQTKNIIYPAEPGSTTNLSTLNYQYNGDGQLEYIKLNGDTVESYTYTPAGYVDTITTQLDFNTSGDKLEKSYTYNTAGLLEQILYDDDSTTDPLEQYDYTYYQNGMIKTETSNVYYTGSKVTTAKTHTYDEIGRLTQTAVTGGTTTEYDYDKVGNRLKITGSDVYDYIYSQFKELDQVNKNSVKQVTYIYDTVGRTKTETQWENGLETFQKRYDYNDAGELASVQLEAPPINGSGYSEEEYYYNYQGQRTMKKNSSVWTEYFYSGTVQLFTSNHLDEMLTENILTPSGKIVASQRFDAGVADGWNFYTYDVRSSTTAILDANGSPVKQYTYDEFGNKTETGSLLNEITYTSAVSDSNTGLYYMNSRYYNPANGRFLTQDSYKGNAYNPWTQNLYTYVGNNPVNMIDPTGHIAIPIAGGIIIVVGIGVVAIADITINHARNSNTFDFGILKQDIKDEWRYRSYNFERNFNKVKNWLKGDSKSDDKENENEEETPKPPLEKWPESDDDIPDDWEWKGSNPDPSSGEGNWHNPDTKESLHNDLNHPDGIEPHWDYKPFRGAEWWRWFRDGTMRPH